MNYRKVITEIEEVLDAHKDAEDAINDIRSICEDAYKEKENELETNIEAAKRLQAIIYKRAELDTPEEPKDVKPSECQTKIKANKETI